MAEALGSTVALLAQVADPHFGSDAITQALAVAQAGDDEPASVFGAFRTPVPGAPLGSPYGIRVDPLTGSVGYHPGIDLEAAAGVEVDAPASGTVVMAGDCGGYGNCVVIDHGHSLATVSAHLSRVLVAVGQPVSDGQVIGLVGSTGRSTGPHLHFEVRLHGAPIDPIATLTSLSAGSAALALHRGMSAQWIFALAVPYPGRGPPPAFVRTVAIRRRDETDRCHLGLVRPAAVLYRADIQ